MKRLFYLFPLLLAAACSELPDEPSAPDVRPAGTADDSGCLPGVLRIKLQASTPDLDTGKFTRSGSSGNDRFDAAATRVGAAALRRVFSDDERFRERHRRAGLHLWYELRFDEQLPVDEAIRRFGLPEGVACVEPVYRMVPVAPGEPRTASAAFFPAARSRTFDDPLQGNQWFLHNDGSLPGSVAGADLNIGPAWSVTTGDSEVIVAVADGGIDWTHPDLAANMWFDDEGYCGYNFNRMNREITPSSHGTHVAGTIAAVNGNGIGICGIAGGDGTPGSGVRMMSCQVFDEVGSAHIEDLMVWSADHGAVISQNSWSYTNVSDLSQAGKAAVDYFIRNAGCNAEGEQTGPMKGGVVIFAAGNDNTSTPKFPAAYEPVVAVASLGADWKKANDSNYGPWIDVAALGGDGTDGDERLTVYSTVPEGRYGFAAGTSMACPQVSGLAALAVAKYGGPGFTAERLKELLIGSGRRQETDHHNPDYIGQLGSGLVDAEYLFFRDEAPDPVAAAAATVRPGKVELTWTVPADYLERPVPQFDIYLADAPFAAATVREIPATAVKYTVENPSAPVGGIMHRTFDDVPIDVVQAAIVSVSRYGTPSAPCLCGTNATDNLPPEITAPLPATYLRSSDKRGATLLLDDYFTDPDARASDRLEYFVAFDTPGIVDCRVEQSCLHVLPLKTGQTTLTVIARDAHGATAGSPLQVTVDGSGAALELFPNPCRDRLNIRMNGISGSVAVHIFNAAGQQVLSTDAAIAPGERGDTASIDVSALAPGTYTCTVVRPGDEAQTRSFIKR